MKNTRISTRIIFLLFLISTFSASSAFPQEVYSNLKRPHHVQSFTEISNTLVCQCGCNFVLSLCPHVECPWGIPARRFIEEKIKQGVSSQEIIDGFKNGFGPEIRNEEYVQKLMDQGREKLREELVKGYGPKISAKSSLFLPSLLLVSLVLGGVFLIRYWFRKKSKSLL